MKRYIFNWLRRITLRGFGFVSDHSAADSIDTQRLDLRFTRRRKKKTVQKTK